MMHRLGVRGRLFIAFFGISAFAVLAAIAAVYSILAIGGVLERTTQQRVPSALGSLEISREAERIVAAAPALLAATTTALRKELTNEITVEVERLNELVANLKSDEIDATVLEAIELAVQRLGENLTALDFLVSNHLAASERKRAILTKLSTTNTGAQRALSPGIRVMDAKFSQLRKVIDNPDLSEAARSAAMSDLTNTISVSLPLQKSQVEVSAINDALIRAASAPTRADLEVLSFPLRKSLSNLERLLKSLTPDQRKYLKPRFEEFGSLATGPDSVLEARGKELDLIASGEELILENVDLSRQLTEAVDELLARAKTDIATGNLEAGSVQRVSTLIMMAVVALSLISSTLIVWLYVGRNLIARLTELSDSMLAIAGGNLRADLPAGGGDEIGRMAEALLIFRDTAIEVEESNLAEIEAARRQLTAAIESISEGFSLYDADDRLVLCNSTYREILYPGLEDIVKPGTSFETIIRRAAELGLIGDAKGRIDDWVAERVELHRNPGGTHVQRRGDEGRWIQVSELKTEDGSTVAIYSDITELKRREEKLEEMDRLKTHFLSSVSHELRTPLTSVRGFAQLIHRDFNRWFLPLAESDSKVTAKGERIVANIGIIQSEGERLTRLINDVLDLSKIEAGSMEWRDTTFSAGDLINHAFNAASGQFADNTEVKVSMAVADDVPEIHADYDRLVQVLVNLLNNAAKFTEAGRIDITAETVSDGWLQISVRDTGSGIPPEDCEKIFDKFHQVTKADVLEDKPKGTGLGLSISLQIVEHYGGRIWVESELGKGSCFNVSLPAAALQEVTATPEEPSVEEEATEGAQDRSGEAPDTAAGGVPLVLVVDADPAIRNYLTQFMENEGYRVASAANGRLALEAARNERPDLITMDLRMPEIDGHAAIRSLRQDGELRQIPIIVISEFALSEETNADAFFSKPIDEEALLAETRRLLSHAAATANEPPSSAAQEM
jgi:signal transduction histidine kinase/ActR/RegA family two-component response regulator